MEFVLNIILSFVFLAVYGLMGVYAERKIAAFIQDRVGPDVVGPYGLLQTFADILKLLQKEIIVPQVADKFLFFLSPVIVFAAVFGAYAVLPFTEYTGTAGYDLGLLWMISILSLDGIALFMAGWASNNKYALMGALRSVSQMIAYEIPLTFVLLSVILIYGTLDVQNIIKFQGGQEGYSGLWDASASRGFLAWSIIQHPPLLLAMILFYTTGIAVCNRAPFDIPEAESELVSGFHVEYGGFAFASIMLAEYANMLLFSLLTASLFLGGWNSPLPNLFGVPLFEYTNGGLLWGTFWMLLKAFILVIGMMWLRWTLPRLRADQLISLCWKIFFPASILILFLSTLWKLFLANAL